MMLTAFSLTLSLLMMFFHTYLLLMLLSLLVQMVCLLTSFERLLLKFLSSLTMFYSVLHGVVPLEWKRSRITPVHKGGASTVPNNYRPIAVVSVLAKILEKIVATKLSAFLKAHHLLYPHQGAYQHGKSPEDILMVAIDIISAQLDKRDSVCAAFLDLRKAFDSLDHSILLHNLSQLGLSKNAAQCRQVLCYVVFFTL